MQNIFYFLRLFLSKNFNNSKVLNLLKTVNGDVKFLVENFAQILKKHEISEYFLASIEEVENYIKKCEKLSIKLLDMNDKKYPKKLLHVTNFPIILHYMGNVQLLNKFSIAIIGSRNASLQGMSFSKKIAKELNEYGYVVVSGLAKGIDACAHASAISATVAVLGHGLDEIYPIENKKLYEDILKNNSLIISEFKLNTAILPYNFSNRNRIIAALASGVVVIEAAMNSGTLITAKYALEQGKDLFAVPGHPYDVRMRGTNYLIKNGANLLQGAQDIISYYNNSHKISLFNEEEAVVPVEYEENKNLKNLIHSKLSNLPMSVYEIAKILNFSIDEIQICIGELELEGRIKNEFGAISLV